MAFKVIDKQWRIDRTWCECDEDRRSIGKEDCFGYPRVHAARIYLRHVSTLLVLLVAYVHSQVQWTWPVSLRFLVCSKPNLYSVRGLERSELGGSNGCPGRFCDRLLWPVYTPSKASCLLSCCRPVIKIGPKGALGSHEIRPFHSAPSLGQSIVERSIIRMSKVSYLENIAGSTDDKLMARIFLISHN